MDFGFSDTQTEIRDTARKLLGDRFKPEKVRELAEAGSYDDALWAQICELGWPGIAIGEEHGGQGLGMIELAILCEQVGYSCAPLPLLSTAAAGLAIEAAGSDEQRAEWLPKLASGEAKGTVAIADGSGNGRALTPDLADADVVVLLGAAGGGSLSDQPTGELIDAIDRTRSYSLVEVSGGEELPGDDGRHPRALCAIALAAEQVGLAQRALEMAVEYAKDRKQFERPIGAYQAVSHRCADMLYDAEEARSLTYYAAWTAGSEPESAPVAAAMAQARASDAAWSVTASALQVHGGIGFTWEHDLQFWLKRAKMDRALFGSPGFWRDRVASAVGLS